MNTQADTICAIATPAGRGGISIIRISGPGSRRVARRMTGNNPSPRHAHYGPFLDARGEIMDTGICLFFPGPDSFTGEDVVELQAHGGPFVVDQLIKEVLALGTRLARPGEFSERAFLNDKIDLAQAEAIADLIGSQSAEAARYAVRSLQGEFSTLVNGLIDSIIDLRKYIEAAIDFPEEEVDFLDEGDIEGRLGEILERLDGVLSQAKQGTIMNEGLTVVIAGAPNAGKSSLLNRLAGQSRAIVTDIAGTTRDTLRESISIDGMPLHIIDTAGLHDSEDIVEQEGIRRAREAIDCADLVLLVTDISVTADGQDTPLLNNLAPAEKIIHVCNKIDLAGVPPRHEQREDGRQCVYLSAQSGDGLDLLLQCLKGRAGLNASEEGGFIARRRHLDALDKSRQHMVAGLTQLQTARAGELVAEDLRNAHLALEIITGRYTPDDLLGEIFTSFCIGK